MSNVNRDSIDDFDTSKDNVYEAVMELLDLFTYLEGNPTGDANEMVSLMFERDYPYWNSIMVSFLELTDNPGWHYIDPGIQIIAIEVRDLEADVATVAIVDRREEQLIANSEGVVVQTYPGWLRRESSATLRNGQDGLWRFADVSPSAQVTDEQVDRMVAVTWKGRAG